MYEIINITMMSAAPCEYAARGPSGGAGCGHPTASARLQAAQHASLLELIEGGTSPASLHSKVEEWLAGKSRTGGVIRAAAILQLGSYHNLCDSLRYQNSVRYSILAYKLKVPITLKKQIKSLYRKLNGLISSGI